ncbi:MAG: glycosyltransferase [Chloroflexi bacterium]|nr:glycosyltransferase [Chloroflexota bacterium]
MEILLLSPDNPFPRESGAAIRNYGIIRGLYGSGHRVTLLTFSEGALSPGTNPLFQYCGDVHSCPIPQRSKSDRIVSLLATRRADMEDRLMSAAFGQKLAAILDSRAFDIIQFSGIELGSYLPVIRQKRCEAKVVYDALNAEAELQRLIYQLDRKRPSRLHTALYSAIQARRLERYERNLCESVDAVIAVSEEDRNLLESYGGAPIYVMPSGIFVDDYQSCHGERRAGNQLVFTGKMDYRPNVDAVEWFCHSVLPALLQRHPALELIIVGRNPHPRIQALADGNHVKVTGWVESVLPYLQAATLFVLPMRMGSGTRLKILEAMASGCAVVSTSLGASGLRGSIRQAIEIADGAEGFAHSISSLLNDMDRRQALGERAREQARAHYDWSAIMRHLLDAYEDLGLG